jgi:NADH dehydrogenase FAD-containing subunit
MMRHGPRIVVLGAGFAGLETAFSLRQQIDDRSEITVVSADEDFIFKPNTIYLPFGGDERRLHVGLAKPLFRRHINLKLGGVSGFDPNAQAVSLSDGTCLRYDYAVIATGATMRPEEIPGLGQYAQTIWTPLQMHRLGNRLTELRAAAKSGRHQRVQFVVPPNNKCAGPLYEMALMLETWLRRHRIRDLVEITWDTYEKTYIQAFGPRLHELVANEFSRRGITGRTESVVSKVAQREVLFDDGTRHDFDLLIAFPPYVSAARYDALPSDDRGFIHTELTTRQVVEHPEIFAPGDAGDFPVKQAFLAFLQADAVADTIASHIRTGIAIPRRPFTPTSMCVMEMFDKATFAQVPLEMTGDPGAPIRVDPDAGTEYLVGTAPIWRLGKKSLGIYLPMQFRAGRPFHGGRPWQAMQLALNGMSHAFASSNGQAEQ